ncbi:hypothetical protein BKH43_02115 [Helicobacter sp. 13S00401-1]|uniref:YceI family protein n=1 Tax=Helicobacter sp. 13S00401-1 TaxID=1905758 RepID=UPI000BA77745|nr:YceI family protein [Helicobacter sp. 13S00401-1]PAF51459.1 hypothetical protein BKH43_02115 [Helicobacter sp. 13S00401-1]
MRKTIVSLVVASALGFGLAQAAPLVIDNSHSRVGFQVTHLMLSSVDGTFDTFTGNVDVEKGELKALSGDLKISSVNTQNQKRDDHLKAADFFDAAKFPDATLKAISIKEDKHAEAKMKKHHMHAESEMKKMDMKEGMSKKDMADDKKSMDMMMKVPTKIYTIEADLTIKGVTKKVKLFGVLRGPVQDMKKNEVYSLMLRGKVNRKDFGVGNGFANSMVSDDVRINITLEGTPGK